MSATPFLRCDECDKEFSGPEPFTQHCMSKAHIQRISSKNMDKSVAYEAAIPMPNTLERKCEVCNISMSGPLPYEQHINGSKHKAELNRQRILRENTPVQVVVPTGQVLKCETCQKCFSGLVSYEQHLNSKKHLRKIEVSGMKTRLSNPEPATCPTVDDMSSDNNEIPPISLHGGDLPPGYVQKVYPMLPAPEDSPPRALANAKEIKKPTGCAAAFKSLFRKKNKK